MAGAAGKRNTPGRRTDVKHRGTEKQNTIKRCVRSEICDPDETLIKSSLQYIVLVGLCGGKV